MSEPNPLDRPVHVPTLHMRKYAGTVPTLPAKGYVRPRDVLAALDDSQRERMIDDVYDVLDEMTEWPTMRCARAVVDAICGVSSHE